MGPAPDLRKPVERWTDDELMEYGKGLDQRIFTADCFDVNDLLAYQTIVGELARRGYTAVKSLTFVKSQS